MHSTKKSINTQEINSNNALAKEKAATKIQAYYRGYVVRREYERGVPASPNVTKESTEAEDLNPKMMEVDGGRDSNCHNR